MRWSLESGDVMKVVLSNRLRRCTPDLWDDSEMAQDESGVRLRGGGRCEQRFTSGLPRPIMAPCGSLTQWLLAQALLPGHILGPPRLCGRF
jgi:hypothetical protein